MARGSVSKRCPCGLVKSDTGRWVACKVDHTALRGPCACGIVTDANGRRLTCKRQHGSWMVRADVGSDADGNRQQIRRSGFASRDEAQAELTAILAGLDSGQWSNDQGVTVGQWLTRWITGLRDVKPTTAAGYRRHVEDVWSPRLGRTLLRDLRRRHVEDVLADLGDGRSPRTIDSYRRLTAIDR